MIKSMTMTLYILFEIEYCKDFLYWFCNELTNALFL